MIAAQKTQANKDKLEKKKRERRVVLGAYLASSRRRKRSKGSMRGKCSVRKWDK